MLFIAGIRPELATAHFMGAVGRIESGRRRPLFNALDRNNYVREAARNVALIRFEQDEEAQFRIAAEETEEGRLIAFLNWCIEHKDEIIALIQLIISLFAGGAVPMSTMAEEMRDIYAAGRENRKVDAQDAASLKIVPCRALLDELHRRLAIASDG